jgi:hypothetical protein
MEKWAVLQFEFVPFERQSNWSARASARAVCSDCGSATFIAEVVEVNLAGSS